ncbi:hypothetical protein [Vibrio campbellii]|uniref:hypothetical protein n=1 Tax=Vibrio campbellii TaxID=680 RepID=UPI00385768C5
MNELKLPQVYADPQFPILHVPRLLSKTGPNGEPQFEYLKQIDTERIADDSFTYIGGDVFENEKNTKLKLQLSMNELCTAEPWLTNVTTYSFQSTRAFNRQVKRTYSVPKPDDVPYWAFHKQTVKDALIKNGIDSNAVQSLVQNRQMSICHGIPTANTDPKHRLAHHSMRNAFSTVIRLYEDGVSVAALVIVSIGGFTKFWKIDSRCQSSAANAPAFKFTYKFFDDDDELIDEI